MQTCVQVFLNLTDSVDIARLILLHTSLFYITILLYASNAYVLCYY